MHRHIVLQYEMHFLSPVTVYDITDLEQRLHRARAAVRMSHRACCEDVPLCLLWGCPTMPAVRMSHCACCEDVPLCQAWPTTDVNTSGALQSWQLSLDHNSSHHSLESPWWKTRSRATIPPNNPTLRHTPRKNRNSKLEEYTHPYVHSNIVYKSKDVEAT